MTIRRAIVVAALVCLSANAGFCEKALMARYNPEQTGYTAEKLQLPIALKWEYTAVKYEDNPAAPVVANGTCYFAVGDQIYAVDLDTGTYKWKYPREQRLGGVVKSTPAIMGDNLYFGAADNNLYCLDAKSGTFKWAYPARGAIRCPPTISDNVVYFGADDNSLYAIDADTGDQIWRVTARDDFSVGVAVGNDTVVAMCMDGKVYGLRSSTGSVAWSYRLPMAPINSSPVLADGNVIVAVGNTIYGLTARSGQLRWAATMSTEVAATPAVNGPDVYVPCTDKKIHAFTIKGRELVRKWALPADMGVTSRASVTVAGDTVYATGDKGVIAAFSAADGSPKWRYIVAPSSMNAAAKGYIDIRSSPVVAEGALTVLSDDGVLHCFAPHAPDNVEPGIFDTKPAQGIAMSGVPPINISAILYDMGSGVDFDSVAISLDGQSTNYQKDLTKSTVTYITEVGGEGQSAKKLDDGIHKIVLTAKDYSGNLLTKEWYFIADNSLPPPKRSLPVESKGSISKEPPRRSHSSRDTNVPPAGSSPRNPTGPGGGPPPMPPPPSKDMPPSPETGGYSAPAPPPGQH